MNYPGGPAACPGEGVGTGELGVCIPGGCGIPGGPGGPGACQGEGVVTAELVLVFLVDISPGSRGSGHLRVWTSGTLNL